ncbi:MAG: thioredoxin family protein [Thiobacillaceae bacterium]|jgi:thioredoxin 1
MQQALYVVIAFAAIIFLMQFSLYWRAHKALGMSAPDTSRIDGEAAKNTRRIYYFYSRHCGPCKTIGPIVDKVRADHPNLIKVDVGQHHDLVSKFGVRATPTFMLVENGLIRKVKLGGMSESRLRAMLGDAG